MDSSPHSELSTRKRGEEIYGEWVEDANAHGDVAATGRLAYALALEQARTASLEEQLETARRYEDEEQRLAAQMREERDEALALVQRVEEQNEFHKGEVALLSEMIDGLKEQLETARTELAEAAQSPASEPDDRTMEEILRDAGAHYQDSDPATKFHAFCKDGSLQPCEICVGSCGIEEAEEAAQSPAKKPETN